MRPIARSAITSPRRSPSISASIIAVGPLPVMPEATEPSLMPADSSVLSSRWISEVRAWTFLIRYRVRSRISFSSRAGMYDPCSSPHSSSSASRAQSFASVLCPFSAFTCAGLTTSDLGEVLFAQRVVHRLGVDPAGLHHHMRHPPRAQVPRHRPQHPVKRAERKDLGLAGPRLIPGRPDRDLDHFLVHVDPRDALMHHLHAQPPPAAATPRPDKDTTRRLPGPRQYRRLTHAHAAATVVTHQGSPST